MPYTNTWDDTQPPDSAARNQVANFFRNLKLDIQERMAVLVTDWTTDPVVPLPSILGTVTGKILSIHWSCFSNIPQVFTTDTWAPSRVGFPVQTNYLLNGNGGDSYVFVAPVALPQGVTITGVNFYADPNGAAANSYVLIKQSKVDGSSAAAFTALTSAATGFTVISKTGLTEVIDNALYFYFLEVTLGHGNTKLYGADVVYNCPDNTATL